MLIEVEETIRQGTGNVILEEEEDEVEEGEEGETACCPRILVVDDDEFNIQALSCLLAHFGEDCHRAFNG